MAVTNEGQGGWKGELKGGSSESIKEEGRKGHVPSDWAYAQAATHSASTASTHLENSIVICFFQTIRPKPTTTIVKQRLGSVPLGRPAATAALLSFFGP